MFEIPQKRNAVTVLKIANIFTEEEKLVVEREQNKDYRRSALGDGDSTDGGYKDSSSNLTAVRKRNRNWEALSSSTSSNTSDNQSSYNHNDKNVATEQDNNVNGLRVASSVELQELEGLCEGKTSSCAIKAEKTLRALIQRAIDSPSMSVVESSNRLPSTMHVEKTVSALVKSGKVKQAANLIEWLDNLYQAKLFDVCPSFTSFHVTISALSKSGHSKMAEILLLRLYELWMVDHVSSDSQSLIVAFNHVIASYARKRNSKKAYELLLFMGENETIHPDSYSFNSVLIAYLQSGEVDKSLEILDLMERMYEGGNDAVKPTRVTYNTIMHTYSKGKQNKRLALKHAQKIFARMEDLARKGYVGVKPDASTYNILLNISARLGGMDGATKTEEIMREMEERYQSGDLNCKPGTITFNTVIKAWASVGSEVAAQNAEAILSLMEELSRGGDSDSMPDQISYNSVINCFSKCQNPEKAELLLRNMPTPNIVSYNTVINCWSKTGNLDRTLALIEEVDNSDSLAADDYTLHSGILSLTQRGSDDIDKIKMAEKFLERIESRYASGMDRPNIRSFGAIIYSCSKCNHDEAARIADSVLWRMDKVCDHENTNAYLSNYNMTIQCWHKSKDNDATVKARKILERLISIHSAEGSKFVPDSYSFNAVIYTASRTRGSLRHKTEALQIAYKTYDDLLRLESLGLIEPNVYTYDSLLKCAFNLIPSKDVSKREQVISQIVRRCIEAGYMDDLVLANVLKNAPKLATSLLDLKGRRVKKKKRINVKKDLPQEWSRKIGIK
eukprot:CAMPEP_0116050124 /NCGR_PEP_ID=MMETSP0322-20121206/195_1 /TAXON_ID=163516 /ORGANISM="Leptocylindrus danicus var. apora, Strain B651" /LENGTH=787 /DNA_ID=CAMNT_0003532617 /DNA_START=137 /DNA_END=2500 /DNA_ORIENTATION=+